MFHNAIVQGDTSLWYDRKWSLRCQDIGRVFQSLSDVEGKSILRTRILDRVGRRDSFEINCSRFGTSWVLQGVESVYISENWGNTADAVYDRYFNFVCARKGVTLLDKMYLIKYHHVKCYF